MKKYKYLILVLLLLILGSILLQVTKIDRNMNEQLVVEVENLKDTIESLKSDFMNAYSLDENEFEFVFYEDVSDFLLKKYPSQHHNINIKFDDVFHRDDAASHIVILANELVDELLLIFVGDDNLLYKITLEITENEISINEESIEYEK